MRQNLILVNFASESRLHKSVGFHLTKNGRESLKLVSNMGFQAWNTNSRLEHSVRKKQDYLFLEMLHRKQPEKSAFLLLFLLSKQIFWEPVVVYHLHGQTVRLTVWINGLQSSGLVNFVRESRLPFVQTSSIYGRMALKKWNTEKQDYLFRCFVAPGHFPLGRLKKSCSIYFIFQPDFPVNNQCMCSQISGF